MKAHKRPAAHGSIDLPYYEPYLPSIAYLFILLLPPVQEVPHVGVSQWSISKMPDGRA